MSYCTLEQLTERYGGHMLVTLSDRAEVATGSIDTALFDRVIAEADATIDLALRVRYALPLESTPPAVRDLAQAIAIYKAHGQTVSDKIRDDYREALRQLQQIASGAMKLDLAGVEPAAAGGGAVIMSSPDRPFTAGKMKGLI